MIEDIKNKYPNTYQCLYKLMKGTTVKKIAYKPMCLFWEREVVTWEVPSDENMIKNVLQEYINEIQEPVWSLCELLATRGYHNFYNNGKDNFIINIDGVEFVFGFDGWSPNYKLLSPRIDKNDYEYKLLNETFYDVVLWETRGRIRQELKDKLCGGEIDDK